jgi:hypothetical protein
LPLSMILIFDFGTVPTVWYFLFFNLFVTFIQIIDLRKIFDLI